MSAISRWDRARRSIEEKLADILDGLGWGAGKPEIRVQRPTEPGHGDLTTNLPFRMAKVAKKPPQAIAEAIAAGWQDHGLARPIVAGAGFLNFWLGDDWLRAGVDEILADPGRYGASRAGYGQRVLLEFVSANPTGPLVVVNGRSAAVGDTLARAMQVAGYVVHREYYVNDAGNQIRALGQAMALRLKELHGEPVDPWPDGVYPGSYVRELAEAYRAGHEAGSTSEASWDALGQWAAAKLQTAHESELMRFRVQFDRWYSERGLRRSGAPEAVLTRLRERGWLYEHEGAQWFHSQQFGDDKDRVLVKADGSLTYFVPDAAYHADKFDRGYDRVIDLLGPDHHGYIGRLRAVMAALGYPEAHLEILVIQLVRLLRGGQPVRMSKRGGKFVTLGELVDEVGVDPARWFFLERAPETPMDFDLDLAEMRSQENPVFYVQYAGARIHSLLRHRSAEDIGAAADLSALGSPTERELLVAISQFPDVVARVAAERAPQYLPRYLHALAGMFHGFYRQHRILDAPVFERRARLALVEAVLVVLTRGLDIMGIEVPRQM